jgi:hypothetical protein
VERRIEDLLKLKADLERKIANSSRRRVAEYCTIEVLGTDEPLPPIHSTRVESRCGAVAVGRTYLFPPFRLAVP